MPQQTFRILHASDFHIGDQPGQGGFPASLIGNPPLLETHGLAQLAAFKKVLQSATPLDALLITGDIAADGQGQNLQAALTALQGFGTDRPGLPIGLLPGNHDRYNPRFNPGGTAFDTLFHPWWWAGPQRVQSVLALPVGAAQPALAILGADLSLAASDNGDGAFGYLGEGRANPATLALLGQATATLQAKQIPVVWATHFPPNYPDTSDAPVGVEYPYISTTLRLLDGQNLVDAAIGAGVGHLVCGHTHRQRWYQTGSTANPTALTVHCAGSATSSAESENWFEWLDITVSGNAVQKVDWTPVRFDATTGFS